MRERRKGETNASALRKFGRTRQRPRELPCAPGAAAYRKAQTVLRRRLPGGRPKPCAFPRERWGAPVERPMAAMAASRKRGAAFLELRGRRGKKPRSGRFRRQDPAAKRRTLPFYYKVRDTVKRCAPLLRSERKACDKPGYAAPFSGKS